jgi:hypothetical protein
MRIAAYTRHYLIERAVGAFDVTPIAKASVAVKNRLFNDSYR